MMITQSSGIAFRQKTVLLATRLLSSQIAKPESPKLSFIEERTKYNEELAALRRGWARDIQLKKESDAALAKIERERIVLRQAVRLRQDRLESLIIQEKERRKKDAADKRFKQHLANNLVVSLKRRQMQQLRFSQMIKDITEESEVWITKDNLNQKINTNLFEETKATTGLVTRSSEHWKYFASAYEYEGHPNVVRFGEFDEHNIRDPKSIFSSPDDAPPDRTSIHRLAELFVDPMINSGEERERFREIVQNVGDTLQYMDKVQYDSKEGNFEDRMSTNWLKDKSIEEWDSSDDEYIEEEMNGSLEWMNHDSEYGMEMPSSMRKYKDKYAHDSDSSDGEDPEIADDDEMVSVKSPTGALRKRVPTNKRR